MISSIVKPMIVWSTNTPMRPRSELVPGNGVISEIVPWGYMRSNRVGRKNVKDKFLWKQISPSGPWNRWNERGLFYANKLNA